MENTTKTPAPQVNPRAKFHFLCGDDEVALERHKSAIVEAHLSREEREENYREISAPQLSRVLGDLVSELSTVSFLPDVRRVVTLYGVADFFDGKASAGRGKKKTAKAAAGDKQAVPATEHLARFIQKELPGLPAVLVVVVVEDYEKWKRVNQANPVVELAQRAGTFVQYREQGVQFAFFDALFARRTAEALALWRRWLENSGGAPKPFMQLAAQLRLLIQAKTLSSPQLKQRGITRDRFGREFLPEEPERNVTLLRPQWRQDKLLRAAGNFTFQELVSAYERLQTLQKYAIPLLSDPYVPDRKLLSELWILEFTGHGGTD